MCEFGQNTNKFWCFGIVFKGKKFQIRKKETYFLNKFLEDLDRNIQETCFCDEAKAECQPRYKGITKLPENPVVAMAYVPFQVCTEQYDAEKALCQGTLFPNLDKPFLGGKCI